MSRSITISATVETSDEATVVKAMEVLGRAATGLALEGISVSIDAEPTATPTGDEDEA